jgi:hypothetical protein
MRAAAAFAPPPPHFFLLSFAFDRLLLSFCSPPFAASCQSAVVRVLPLCAQVTQALVLTDSLTDEPAHTYDLITGPADSSFLLSFSF